MPTYEYTCKECQAIFDIFHGMTEQPQVMCPKCGSRSTARLLTGGAGLIFKGSGFYITDYKNGATKTSNDAGKTDSGATNTSSPAPAPKDAKTESASGASTASAKPESAGTATAG